MPTTRRMAAARPAEATSSSADTQESKKGEKLSVRIKDRKSVSLEIPISTPVGASKAGRAADEGEVFKTPMERRHITFDDSDREDDEFVTPREAPLKNPLEEAAGAKNEQKGKEDQNDDENEEDEDEDESDDEAPEAISTHVAEAQTAQATKAAATAAKKQAASERRKRQERDTFFKQQAEEKKRAKKEASKGDEEEQEAVPEETPKAAATEKRKREVPKLLPLDLLESDDEDSVPQQSKQGSQKRRKLAEAKSLVRERKLPKDQKVGSTVVRVVAKRGDERLAPKSNKQSVNLKELLLKRDRNPQIKRGFFVK